MKVKQSIVSHQIFVFLFLGVLVGTLHAQENENFYTLEKGIAEAMANNWGLRAKKEKIDQARYVKNQARAEFFPKLSTTYGYTRLSEVRTFRSSLMPGQEIAISSLDNYQWKGIVSQPIFTGFSLISSFELGKLGIDQSQMDLELEKLDLALKVKEAYFNILIADKGLEVARKEVESLQSNLKVARSFYQVGMIPINELLKAEVELADAQQNLVKAQNASQLARSTFNTVLSRPISTPVEVEDILVYKPEVGEFQDYVQKAFQSRPEIKLLDINLLQTEQQTRLAKSKNYPEVSLNYEYIKEGDTPNVSGSPFHDASEWRVMAVLSWTLWEWGKTYYSAKEKESVRAELMQTRMALKDIIKLELKKAFLDLIEAEKNIPTTEKAVEQAEENLRVNEQRYKAQVTTITEVLDAQTLLTRARVNYYTALYGHHLARARLYRAVGEY